MNRTEAYYFLFDCLSFNNCKFTWKTDIKCTAISLCTKMQSTICILFIAITVLTCRAKIEIIQDNGISIEFDKPLTIRCTNDRTSDVEFRHEQLVVAYCFGKYGCKIDDGRFNITQNTSAGRNEYILTSNDAIQTDLCGVYECNDLLYLEKDSAQVSIIGFDTEKYNATEEKDTIYLTTACTFHVSLSDMQIVWYTYDNTILRLLDETRMGHSMTPFNSASVCSDECDTISAYRFTFGLNITDQEQGYTDVFIETEIFHPDYKNKPLTWRSSNTFRVKDSSPKTSISWVALSFIVLASVLVTVLIAGAIYVLIRFRRRRMNRAGTYIHTNTEKSMNRALRIRESMPRFRSRGKKAAKSRHVGTQPVGESVRDSQSDEGISNSAGKIVSIHDTEIESDGDLGYISGEKKNHLRDSGIHSQSDVDFPYLSIHDTELQQMFAL